MKVIALSSGSKGNCYYIETSKNKLLLDAGRNYKYIKDKLDSIGVNIKDINYILISHNHTDHISALKSLIEKTQATIVITQKMFYEIEEIKDYQRILIYEDDIDLDGVKVEAIHSSHDAPDSRNFIIEDENKKVAYITDTGYINNKYFKKLTNLDMYLFESNHDIEMLEHGPYPAWLKKRVLSDVGHLSNNSAGFYLTKLLGPNTKKVILIHLSETNNLPDIALDTVKKTLVEYGIDFDNIVCASQNELSEMVEI